MTRRGKILDHSIHLITTRYGHVCRLHIPIEPMQIDNLAFKIQPGNGSWDAHPPLFSVLFEWGAGDAQKQYYKDPGIGGLPLPQRVAQGLPR